jgi:hypothetical protein
MKNAKLIVAICATMAFGIAAADDKDKDPPPKKDRVCTIGWYKNNGFDSWYPSCLEIEGGAAVCDALNDAMYATGAGAGAIKNAAADTIVANYVSEETCEVED